LSSFGETLRRERELRGIDLREVAEATKISVRFLQALEQDRVDILPGGIFPKAFVRQYARHLGLDAERLVAGGEERARADGRGDVEDLRVGEAVLLELVDVARRHRERPARHLAREGHHGGLGGRE